MTVNKKIYDAFKAKVKSLDEIEKIKVDIHENMKKLENPIHKEYKNGDYERFKEDDGKLIELIANEKRNLDAKFELLNEILELIPEDGSTFIYDEPTIQYKFSKRENKLFVKTTVWKAHVDDIVEEKTYSLDNNN